MFVVGDAVLIHGLVKSPELNFHSGLIVGCAKDTSRYIVDLIADDTDELSGKTVRVKFDNLLSADKAADDLFNYSDDSDTNADESQPSPHVHGDRLGPSRSYDSWTPDIKTNCPYYNMKDIFVYILYIYLMVFYMF